MDLANRIASLTGRRRRRGPELTTVLEGVGTLVGAAAAGAQVVSEVRRARRHPAEEEAEAGGPKTTDAEKTDAEKFEPEENESETDGAGDEEPEQIKSADTEVVKRSKDGAEKAEKIEA